MAMPHFQFSQWAQDLTPPPSPQALRSSKLDQGKIEIEN
jgi:hypothetical protein